MLRIRFTSADQARVRVDILRAAYSVVPASGNFADFLTPPMQSGTSGVDEQFDAILRVRRAVVPIDVGPIWDS